MSLTLAYDTSRSTRYNFNLKNDDLLGSGRTQQAYVTVVAMFDKKEIEKRKKGDKTTKDFEIFPGGDNVENHHAYSGQLLFGFVGRKEKEFPLGFVSLNGLNTNLDEYSTSKKLEKTLRLIGSTMSNKDATKLETSISCQCGGSFNLKNLTGETTVNGDYLEWYIPEYTEKDKSALKIKGSKKFLVPYRVTQMVSLQSYIDEKLDTYEKENNNQYNREAMSKKMLELLEDYHDLRRRIFARVLTGSMNGEEMTCMFVEFK